LREDGAVITKVAISLLCGFAPVEDPRIAVLVERTIPGIITEGSCRTVAVESLEPNYSELEYFTQRRMLLKKRRSVSCAAAGEPPPLLNRRCRGTGAQAEFTRKNDRQSSICS
jgi:hypothetical protein